MTEVLAWLLPSSMRRCSPIQSTRVMQAAPQKHAGRAAVPGLHCSDDPLVKWTGLFSGTPEVMLMDCPSGQWLQLGK